MWTNGYDGTSPLYVHIGDGTSFAQANDSDSLRNQWTDSDASYLCGVGGYGLGPVEGATINFRARADDPSLVGTIQVNLYDGANLIGTGAVHNLVNAWTNYTDAFSNISASDVNNLRLEVHMIRTFPTNAEYIRLSMMWVDVEYLPL